MAFITGTGTMEMTLGIPAADPHATKPQSAAQLVGRDPYPFDRALRGGGAARLAPRVTHSHLEFQLRAARGGIDLSGWDGDWEAARQFLRDLDRDHERSIGPMEGLD